MDALYGEIKRRAEYHDYYGRYHESYDRGSNVQFSHGYLQKKWLPRTLPRRGQRLFR
jgi:hypothetical protein